MYLYVLAIAFVLPTVTPTLLAAMTLEEMVNDIGRRVSSLNYFYSDESEYVEKRGPYDPPYTSEEQVRNHEKYIRIKSERFNKIIEQNRCVYNVNIPVTGVRYDVNNEGVILSIDEVKVPDSLHAVFIGQPFLYKHYERLKFNGVFRDEKHRQHADKFRSQVILVDRNGPIRVPRDVAKKYNIIENRGNLVAEFRMETISDFNRVSIDGPLDDTREAFPVPVVRLTSIRWEINGEPIISWNGVALK